MFGNMLHVISVLPRRHTRHNIQHTTCVPLKAPESFSFYIYFIHYVCFLVYLNGAFDTPYGHKWIVWDPKEPSVMYPHNGCPNPVPNGFDILARKCLFDFSFQAERVYHIMYIYIRVYQVKSNTPGLIEFCSIRNQSSVVCFLRVLCCALSRFTVWTYPIIYI